MPGLRAFFAPEEVSLDVDPSNVRAEKAIRKALAKLDLSLVKTEKVYEGKATRMLFRKE